MGAAHSLWETFSIISCCLGRSSSFPTEALMANDTERGLKNLGAASGWTCALYGSTVPNSSAKSCWCCFISMFNDCSRTVQTAVMLLQSKHRYFSQLRPKILGLLPPMTIRTSFAS